MWPDATETMHRIVSFPMESTIENWLVCPLRVTSTLSDIAPTNLLLLPASIVEDKGFPPFTSDSRTERPQRSHCVIAEIGPVSFVGITGMALPRRNNCTIVISGQRSFRAILQRSPGAPWALTLESDEHAPALGGEHEIVVGRPPHRHYQSS